jgi:hypothetical protein
MISENLKKSINSIRLICLLIWGQMLIMVPAFYVVLHIIGKRAPNPNATPMDSGTATILKIVFGIFSFAAIFAAYFIDKFYFSPKNMKKNLKKKYTTVKVLNLDEKEGKIRNIIAGYQGLYMIKLALIDSVSIFGFIIAILEKNIQTYVPFGVLALFIIALHFPNFNKLVEKVETEIKNEI